MRQYTLQIDESVLQIILKGLAELPLKESLRPLQIVEAQIIQQQQKQLVEKPADGNQAQ